MKADAPRSSSAGRIHVPIESLTPRTCPWWAAAIILLSAAGCLLSAERFATLPAAWSIVTPNWWTKLNLGLIGGLALVTAWNFLAVGYWCRFSRSDEEHRWPRVLFRQVEDALGLTRDHRRVVHSADTVAGELRTWLQFGMTARFVLACGLAAGSLAVFVFSVQAKGGVKTPLDVLLWPLGTALLALTVIVVFELFSFLRATSRIAAWRESAIAALTIHPARSDGSVESANATAGVVVAAAKVSPTQTAPVPPTKIPPTIVPPQATTPTPAPVPPPTPKPSADVSKHLKLLDEAM